MPRNSQGAYTLPAGNPVVTGTTIQSTWANTTMSDIGSEITNSLDRSGRGAMLAPLKIADGTNAAPGLAFNLETTTGLYRVGAGEVGMTVLGTLTHKFTANGVQAANGAVGTPSYSWLNSPTSGLYRIGADNIGLALAGVIKANFAATRFGFFGAGTLGLFDIRDGGAYGGGAAVSTSDAFNIESNVDTGISILTPNTVGGRVTFGDPESSSAGQIRYNHPDDTMTFRAGATDVISFTTAQLLAIQPKAVFGPNAAGVAYNGGVIISEAAYGGAGPVSTASDLTIESNGSAGITILTPNNATAALRFADPESATVGGILYGHTANEMTFLAGAAITMVVGTNRIEYTSDSGAAVEMGFRGIPIVGFGGGNLAAARRGYCYQLTGGVTVLNGTFSAGDAVSLYNDTAGNLTITQGAGVTLRLAGTATTGSRTLATRGFATIWFKSSSEAIISGAGVS